MQATRILLIDDDPSFIDLASYILKKLEFEVKCASDFKSATRLIEDELPSVILLDYQLGEQSGLDLIAPIKRLAPSTPIIMITAEESTELVVQSIKSGACDFIPKPIDEARMLALLTKAIEHHRLLLRVSDLEDREQSRDQLNDMIGGSSQMQTVFHIIRNVAPTDTSVMIVGESGTGKELVARALHQNSKRADKPFVALNMAALPRELVESTLFGHERGAFTGADRKRIGACEEANGGTLFLDEILEMPIELQPKLLRFLQEQMYRPVGGSQDFFADVRIISATNRNPLEEVNQKRMRGDLYYRLNVVPVNLPSLRERLGDVRLLCTHALQRLNAKQGKNFDYIAPDAMALFERYDWPGNMRQLMHVIERIVVLNSGPILTAAMIPDEIIQPAQSNVNYQTIDQGGAELHIAYQSPDQSFVTEGEPVEQSLASSMAGPVSASPPNQEKTIMTMEEIEKQAIEAALLRCKGSASKAAKELQVSEATIYRKIKSYGLQEVGK